MNSIDLTPLYRSSIGFDRLASLIDSALTSESVGPGYPPYNIEILDENKYAITLAVAGFLEEELDIKVEKGTLCVHGEKKTKDEHKYLHQGINVAQFKREFSLADYVEVSGASLSNGLLSISLVKEIPEAMKPKTIAINQVNNALEHKRGEKLAEKSDKAA